jgi:hypothetical protein
MFTINPPSRQITILIIQTRIPMMRGEITVFMKTDHDLQK